MQDPHHGDGADAEKAPAPARAAEAKDVQNVSAVPNGGFKAWLQVAGSFFLAFNTWYASGPVFVSTIPTPCLPLTMVAVHLADSACQSG